MAQARRYRGLLEQQWSGPSEAVLSQAYGLGRELLAENATLLEVVALHHNALAEGLEAEATAPPSRVRAAGQVLSEMLASYEMLLRGYGDANRALRGMNARLEAQVTQIARTLHDESGQLLAAVMIRMDQALAGLPASAQAEFAPVRELLDRVEFQLRRLAHELHPTLLTDLGLRPALEFLSDGVAARTGLAIAIEGHLAQRLPAPVELSLYRCVQECFNNVVRHAHARRVQVQLRAGAGAFEIRVCDDGRGFDPAVGGGGGMGLAGMRERLREVGGEVAVDSRPGEGTVVTLRVAGAAYGGPNVVATFAGR